MRAMPISAKSFIGAFFTGMLVLTVHLLCSARAWSQGPSTGGIASATSPAPVEHPLMPALRLCQLSVDKLQTVQDYEATFLKREVIGNRLQTQRMLLRLRERPFSVYLRSIEPNAGREVLFVSGQNNNQLLVHEGPGTLTNTLVGTIALDINSPTALAESRHPITEIGIRNMFLMLLQQWELESKYQESNVKYFPNARMGDLECEVVENSHPQPRRQFKFHITRLYIDKATRLPVRVENFGWPQPGEQAPPLIEEYTYLNLKVNLGLTDRHFDRRNPEYKF